MDARGPLSQYMNHEATRFFERSIFDRSGNVVSLLNHTARHWPEANGIRKYVHLTVHPAEPKFSYAENKNLRSTVDFVNKRQKSRFLLICALLASLWFLLYVVKLGVIEIVILAALCAAILRVWRARATAAG